MITDRTLNAMIAAEFGNDPAVAVRVQDFVGRVLALGARAALDAAMNSGLVTSALLARAQGHPRVLEIMADCADAIDAENSALAEPGEADDRYLRAAHELRERAVAIRAEDPEIWEDQPQPINMILHCPACGMQHVDEPMTDAQYTERLHESSWWECGGDKPERWTNPPHRSHLCHGCGHIWRPADVPTNGVEAIKTRGKNDSPAVKPPAARLTDTEDLYERLDSMSKSLEYSGRLDEQENPGTYATVLDAMNFVRSNAAESPQPALAGGWEVVRSVIYDCPALKLPQSLVLRMGGVTQIVVLKGASKELADQIASALNKAVLFPGKTP